MTDPEDAVRFGLLLVFFWRTDTNPQDLKATKRAESIYRLREYALFRDYLYF